MRRSRLRVHGAAVASCRASWRTTPTPLTTSAALVDTESAATLLLSSSPLVKMHHSPQQLSRRNIDAVFSSQHFARQTPQILAQHAVSEDAVNTPNKFFGVSDDRLRSPERQVSLQLCKHGGAVRLCSAAFAALRVPVLATPYRHFHTSRICANGGNKGEDATLTDYDEERHVENAEAVLRETYGPQAKLVVHRLPQRRHQHRRLADTSSSPNADATADAHGVERNDDAEHNEETTSSQAAAAVSENFYFRASATFRLLGFPVELAVASGPRARETIDACLRQALGSDITFIRPRSSNSHRQHHQGSRNAGNRSDGGTGRTNTVSRGGRSGNRRGSTNANVNNTDNHHSPNTAGDQRSQPRRRAGGEASFHDGETSRHQRASGFASVDHPTRSQTGEATYGGSGNNHHHHHRSFTSQAASLTPHQLELKSILDDLRQMCVHFSRTVKFSIKPPSLRHREPSTAENTGVERTDATTFAVVAGEDDDGGAGSLEETLRSNQWRCRCYVKEEWSTTPHARLAVEEVGSSPNDALVRCITHLRDQYRAELGSAAVLEEGVREVAGMVLAQHKSVTATCTAEASTSSPSSPSSEAATASASAAHAESGATLLEVPTYRAQLSVTDRRDNVFIYTARRQATPYAAYEAVATMALRGEKVWDSATHLLSEGMATPPLLWRLRWQFDILVDHICRETGQAPESVAWIQLTGDAGADTEGTDVAASTSGSVVTSTDATVPYVSARFIGSLYSEGQTLLWQTSGGGRYRVEFDTYAQALYHLLDQYADCLASLPCMQAGVGEGLLFPTTSVLDLHVHRHDSFPVLQHHRGNINCYALLGTLTAQMLGCPYTTHYHFDAATSEHVATLTVNDGRLTTQPLIQRRSKQKGEAWRFACLDAIRENFPQQYAAILDRHPEIDLSAEGAARSAHMRALPLEKRIPYFANITAMVMTLVEEDLGWRQPRVRLRNTASNLGLPQWTAELEVRVDGEEGRRVVAVSAPAAQVQQSRRALVFRLAKQYFPKEYAIYASLNRPDIVDPAETGQGPVTKYYAPSSTVNPSMVGQVLALMETARPASAPIRVTLRADADGVARDDGSSEVDSGEEADVGLLDGGTVKGDTSLLRAEDPFTILRAPRMRYTAQVLANHGDVLMADFDSNGAATVADAQAVPVLVTAMKSASFHVAGGAAEALWTEYETYPLPPATSASALAVALFDAFFGSAGHGLLPPATKSNSDSPSGGLATGGVDAAGGMDYSAAVTVVTTRIGDYWFGTAVLPALGMLPIARAVAATKRTCRTHALIAAARHSFPRVLQYAAVRDAAASTMVSEILTEPIVEQLPPSARRDLLAQLRRHKRVTPLPPFPLLIKCTRAAYPRSQRFIRVQHSFNSSHGFQYRLYLQRSRVVVPGDTQLVGYGASAVSPAVALHHAALMALENLFESALDEAVAAQADYRVPPSETD